MTTKKADQDTNSRTSTKEDLRRPNYSPKQQRGAASDFPLRRREFVKAGAAVGVAGGFAGCGSDEGGGSGGTRMTVPSQANPFQADVPVETVIAITGDGTQGSFATGALLFLKTVWDDLDIKGVCGTSGGALPALVLSESGEEGIEKAARLYTALGGESDLFEDAPWRASVEFLLERHFDADLESILSGDAASTHNLRNLAAGAKWGTSLGYLIGPSLLSFFSVAFGTLSLWRIEPKLEAYFRILDLATNAKSMYTLEPLRQLIEETIDFEKVGAIPLRLTTLRLGDGTSSYADERGYLHDSSGSEMELWNEDGYPPLLDAFLASFAVPGLFPPMVLRDPIARGTLNADYFVGAGAREMASVASAETVEPDLIISIHPTPPPRTRDVIDLNERPTIGDATARSVDVILDEINRNEFYNEPMGGDIERVLIYPLQGTHDDLDVDPHLFRISMASGYMTAYLRYRIHFEPTTQLRSGLSSSDRITDARRRSWYLERRVVDRAPLEGQDLGVGDPVPVAFHGENLSYIREYKAEIATDVDKLVRSAEEDRSVVPEVLPTDRGPESITDWWQTWEHQYDDYYGPLLQAFDLWGPLPVIDEQASTPTGRKVAVMEDPADVPDRPTSEYFG